MSRRATQVDKPPRASWQFHLRSWLVAAVLVGLPWILVAGPGVYCGGAGTLGVGCNGYLFGWPMVHARESRLSVSGNYFR